MATENENETKEVKDGAAEGAAATAASGAAAEMASEVFTRTAPSNPQDAKTPASDKGQSLQEDLDKGGSLTGVSDLLKQSGSLDNLNDLGKAADSLKDLMDRSKRAEDLAKIIRGDELPRIGEIIRSPWQQLTMKTEGMHDLQTGDRLVVKDGKETLVTTNGDVITVNKDGSVKVEGEIKEVSVDQDGNQVYTMSDGAKVRIGKDGISSVERNHQRASLVQPFKIGPIRHPFEQIKPLWADPSRDLDKYPGVSPDHRKGS